MDLNACHAEELTDAWWFNSTSTALRSDRGVYAARECSVEQFM